MNDGNYVSTGSLSCGKLAEWLWDEKTDRVGSKGDKKNQKFLKLVESVCSGNEKSEELTLVKYMAAKLKHDLNVGSSYSDEFAEYKVVEMKKNSVSKVRIHILSAEEKAISEEDAKKTDLTKEIIYSYEAGYILGTDPKQNICTV